MPERRDQESCPKTLIQIFLPILNDGCRSGNERSGSGSTASGLDCTTRSPVAPKEPRTLCQKPQKVLQVTKQPQQQHHHKSQADQPVEILLVELHQQSRCRASRKPRRRRKTKRRSRPPRLKHQVDGVGSFNLFLFVRLLLDLYLNGVHNSKAVSATCELARRGHLASTISSLDVMFLFGPDAA